MSPLNQYHDVEETKEEEIPNAEESPKKNHKIRMMDHFDDILAIRNPKEDLRATSDKHRGRTYVGSPDDLFGSRNPNQLQEWGNQTKILVSNSNQIDINVRVEKWESGSEEEEEDKEEPSVNQIVKP